MRGGAWIALVVCVLALAVAETDHVRCTATATTSTSGTATAGDSGCESSYGMRVALPAALVALGAGVAALVLARRSGAGGLGATLAAALLLVPTLLVLAGWASIGFDVRLAQLQPDGGTYCTGAMREPPVFLQGAPQCARWADLARVGVVAVAAVGAIASVATGRRALARITAAFVVAAVLAIEAPRLVADPLDVVAWLVPLAAAALLAAGSRLEAPTTA